MSKGCITLCVTMLAMVVILGACAEDERSSPTRGRLALGVCPSEAPLVEQLVGEFHARYPRTRCDIAVLPADSVLLRFSSRRLAAMVIDRELEQRELEALRAGGIDAQAIRVGSEGIAVLVPDANRYQRIALTLLDSMVRGEATRWDAVAFPGTPMPVTILMPDSRSGIYRQLWKRCELSRHAAARMIGYERESDIAALAVRYPGAVLFAPAAMLDALPPGVHALRIAWVDSAGTRRDVPLHQAHVYSGAWPLTVPVMYYFHGGMNNVAAGLGAFISSNPGQSLVLKSGRAPANVPVRIVHLSSTNGEQP